MVGDTPPAESWFGLCETGFRAAAYPAWSQTKVTFDLPGRSRCLGRKCVTLVLREGSFGTANVARLEIAARNRSWCTVDPVTRTAQGNAALAFILVTNHRGIAPPVPKMLKVQSAAVVHVAWGSGGSSAARRRDLGVDQRARSLSLHSS
jgi:hypothetical protein